jgi:drug/metabolite transporter (DMT)-like permease
LSGLSPRITTGATFVVLVLIWGTTWSVIRVGLRSIPPVTGVALRFALASALLFALALVLRVRLGQSRRERALWLANGLLTFLVPYGVLYWAEQWVPSGLSAVLFATYPLFVALFGFWLLPGERPTAIGLAGLAVGFLGVAVIFSDDLARFGGRQAVLAAAILLVAPLLAALGSVIVKRWAVGIHPLSLTAVPMALTAVTMGGLALFVDAGKPLRLEGPAVGGLLYLAVFGSAVPFVLFFWLLGRMPAGRVALLNYLIPIAAVVVGNIFLAEPVTARMIGGAALVLAGVTLAARKS